MVKLLTEGSIEHGYPLLKNDLRSNGLNVEDFDSYVTMVGQLLINSNVSGVYGR
jgi:hypothetical protein